MRSESFWVAGGKSRRLAWHLSGDRSPWFAACGVKLRGYAVTTTPGVQLPRGKVCARCVALHRAECVELAIAFQEQAARLAAAQLQHALDYPDLPSARVPMQANAARLYAEARILLGIEP